MFDFNPWNGLVLFQALSMEDARKSARRPKRESILRRLLRRARRASFPAPATPGKGVTPARTASRSVPAAASPRERDMVLSIR